MVKLLSSIDDYDTSILSPAQMRFFDCFLRATLDELISIALHFNKSCDDIVVYYKKGYGNDGEVVEFWIDGLEGEITGIIFACPYSMIDIHPGFVAEWTGVREDSKYISYGEYGSSLETVTFDT